MANMTTDYSDAQMIWPLEGSPWNCSREFVTPIMANTTGTRICGLHNNRTVAEQCCTTEVRNYQCWHYCESNATIGDWAMCVSQITGGAGSSINSPQNIPFCQGALMSNNTETLRSSSYRSATPKICWIVLTLLIGFLFVGPTHATIIHSLGDGLAKRQSAGDCVFNVDQTYTTQINQVQNFGGSRFSGQPAVEIDAETPLDANNRTLNGTSAAEPEYDEFFDVVSNVTNGRRFPAMSSVRLSRGIAVFGPTDFYVQWAPISVRTPTSPAKFPLNR